MEDGPLHAIGEWLKRILLYITNVHDIRIATSRDIPGKHWRGDMPNIERIYMYYDKYD